MTDIKALVEGASLLGLELDQEKIDEFIKYKELLKEWNEKVNITTITDDFEIDIKHFIDSLTPLTTDYFKENIRVIDIGTGGGFPGLPLKIMNKSMDVTLVDSTKKKINFLKDVIESLGLEKVQAIHGRAEEMARDPLYREKFNIAISRAVAQLNTLCEYCLPFVEVGGYFISMKGSDIEDELKEAENSIKVLGGKLKETRIVKLPLSDITHSLIIIEKVRNTSTKYPRGGGKPRKKPL
ncbi:MAG: 16S rRNA (guanine(527)-N(7))-methyltransferase RsmG [Tissierellia bacterium]|nr:16S rRNA (guanine(527)-N(7))-methyltransferase RsmG [Tissierellia bacterium]